MNKTRTVNKTIQLMPGLAIQFAPDGTWLYFTGAGHEGAIDLEQGLRYEVCAPAVKGFVDETRAGLEMEGK